MTCRLGQCSQQGRYRGIIAERLAAMGEAVDITWAEDKTTSQLERISPELVLRMPGSLGTGAGLGIVIAPEVKQVCAFEFHDGIGFALFVNEQGKSDARFLAKSTSINAVSKPHSSQVGAAVSEGLFVRAQLRDVLAAEDSTVMAQENNHGRLTHP